MARPIAAAAPARAMAPVAIRMLSPDRDIPPAPVPGAPEGMISVGLGDAVAAGVAVGDDVAVGLAVGDDVAVGLAVGVAVGDDVAVGVALGDGDAVTQSGSVI